MKEILNHFVSKTIPTLSPGTSAQLAYHELLPRLATQDRYVLNGILAVGYLHASSSIESTSLRESYHDLAAIQVNTGMTRYRSELQSVTIKNAEALFAFQTMITTFVFFTSNVECKKTLATIRGTAMMHEQRKKIGSNLVHAISRTFRSLRGVLVILVPCYHFLRHGSFAPVLERDWWPAPIPVTTDEIEQDKKLRILETMWAQPGITYEYSFDALRSALKDLRESFALLSRLAYCTFPGDTPSERTFDWTAALHWPVQLSLHFMSMLDQHRMEAWVLMAHYAILTSKARFNPWLDGFAAHIITTSALVIGEDNWKWIRWPAEVVGLDLESLRITSKTQEERLNAGQQ
ncbi:hypothetical protein EK21DRAFT_103388 [Setomelanomma holmii]|uniref:Uncharacterized protein n=1 Tax=Setomelanomma holmii TaxID=210430 RepID=A0A9P4LI77_9PLEO|nr:hypothetical protein EK21DRAFT_103388 [Setomelanomma holmii]